MALGMKSTRPSVPLQAMNTDEAPASGFYLTTEYAYLGDDLPNTNGNAPNARLQSPIAVVYVGGNRQMYQRQPGQNYTKVPVPPQISGE